MAKDKRVEILFDERDYRRLAEAARRRRQSVGSVVREAVAEYVTRPTEEERQRAFERLLAMDTGPVGTPEELSQFWSDTHLLDSLETTNYPEDAELIRILKERIESYRKRYSEAD